jgi:ribosome biogenesis protein ERB1
MSLKSQGKRKAPQDEEELSEEELLPEIVDFSDDEESLQNERLQEEEDETSEDDGSDLEEWIARNSGLPAENQDFTSGLLSTDDPVSVDFAKQRKLVKSDITGLPKSEWPEIDPDDDSEPEVENRVGDIPAHFYDDMPHVGYDINGKRILKPLKGDELDKFLATVEGSAW